MKLSLKSTSVKSKGFTLIEVLVALVILAISLLGLTALMATTTRNTSSGGHLTEAATLAQDKLEELRASYILLRVNTMDQDRPPLTSTGITYTRSWRMDQLNVAGTLNKITVTITWADGTKLIPHSISMVSAVASQ